MSSLASQLGFNATDQRSITEMLGTTNAHPFIQKKGEQQGGGGGIPIDKTKKNEDGTCKVRDFDEVKWRKAIGRQESPKRPRQKVKNTTVEEIRRVHKDLSIIKVSDSHKHKNTRHVQMKDAANRFHVFIIPSHAATRDPEFKKRDEVNDDDVVEIEDPEEEKEEKKDKTEKKELPEGTLETYPTITSPPLELDVNFDNAKSGTNDPGALRMLDYDPDQIQWVAWFIQQHPEVQLAFQGYSDGSGSPGRVSAAMRRNPAITGTRSWADIAYKRSYLVSQLFTDYFEWGWRGNLMNPVVSPAAGRKAVSIYLKGPASPDVVRDYNRMAKALKWPQYPSGAR